MVIPCILWNPTLHCRVHNSPPFPPVMNQINPAHGIPSTPLRYILILSFPLHTGLPSGLFPSGFLIKTLHAPLLSPHVPHAPPIHGVTYHRAVFFKRFSFCWHWNETRYPYLDCGREALLHRFGLIGGHHHQVVQRLCFPVKQLPSINSAILRYSEVIVVITCTYAVHYSSVVTCNKRQTT